MGSTTSQDANQDQAERRLPNAESPLQNNEIKEEFSTSEMKSACPQRIKINRDRVADHVALFLTSSYKRMLQTASSSRSCTSTRTGIRHFILIFKKIYNNCTNLFPPNFILIQKFTIIQKIFLLPISIQNSFLRYSAHATAPNNAITPTLHIT